MRESEAVSNAVNRLKHPRYPSEDELRAKYGDSLPPNAFQYVKDREEVMHNRSPDAVDAGDASPAPDIEIIPAAKSRRRDFSRYISSS